MEEDDQWTGRQVHRVSGPQFVSGFANHVRFILDFVRDFPHIRQTDREHTAIRASIAMGALPRLKATITTVRLGYETSIHSNFSFGSEDIFSLVTSLIKLPEPSRYIEGFQLMIRRCRRAVLGRIGPGAVPTFPSFQPEAIYRLGMEFVEGVMLSHGDSRFDSNRLARFYDAAVSDAFMVLSPRIRLLSPDPWGCEIEHGHPCYLSLEVPNVHEAKLVASSVSSCRQAE